MPDFSESVPGLDPPTVLDHVLLPVADLTEGARRLRERYGLEAVAGGRHANLGTENKIVPLGRQYLELIAVADRDEASASSIGKRVLRAVSERRVLMAWALRTTDLDALRAKLRAGGWTLPETWEGSRRRPDGRLLRWRTQDLIDSESTALPFVIEWDIPEGAHPGEAAAPGQANAGLSLRRVVAGSADPTRTGEQLRVLLGGGDRYEVRETATEGLEALVISGPGGDVIVT